MSVCKNSRLGVRHCGMDADADRYGMLRRRGPLRLWCFSVPQIQFAPDGIPCPFLRNGWRHPLSVDRPGCGLFLRTFNGTETLHLRFTKWSKRATPSSSSQTRTPLPRLTFQITPRDRCPGPQAQACRGVAPGQLPLSPSWNGNQYCRLLHALLSGLYDRHGPSRQHVSDRLELLAFPSTAGGSWPAPIGSTTMRGRGESQHPARPRTCPLVFCQALDAPAGQAVGFDDRFVLTTTLTQMIICPANECELYQLTDIAKNWCSGGLSAHPRVAGRVPAHRALACAHDRRGVSHQPAHLKRFSTI